MPLNLAVVSVADIVDATISKFSANIRDAGVTVTQDVPPNTPAVNVDADIIHRVMMNLLGNAIRFTPSGGEIRFIATPDEARRVVTVRVVDTGPGIPPNEVERIFEKFRQVEGSVPQRGHKGSGVGLSFCKTAIEAHNQKIWVEQDGPLSGACFAFTLPYATLVTV
jgi:signal transduction histidine kinase